MQEDHRSLEWLDDFPGPEIFKLTTIDFNVFQLGC
jgi:hypothetical protein